jgi:hypothetical protein
MGQQMPAADGLRRVLARAEEDVTAEREGAGIDPARQGLGGSALMHAHPAEVAAEPGLEEAPRTHRQGRAGIPGGADAEPESGVRGSRPLLQSRVFHKPPR